MFYALTKAGTRGSTEKNDIHFSKGFSQFKILQMCAH